MERSIASRRPEKVEAAVRERLQAVRARISADPALARLTEEERDLASGEIKGLLWALGEDPLTQKMRQLMPTSDPSGSSGAGAPTFTWQKRHARVQTSPINMTVAVPPPQHSATFGQRASSHTVDRRVRRTMSLTRS